MCKDNAMGSVCIVLAEQRKQNDNAKIKGKTETKMHTRKLPGEY